MPSPKSRQIDCVIFDLDGLLLDTERLQIEAENRVLSIWKHSMDQSTKNQIMGLPGIRVAEHLINRFDLPIGPREFLSRVRQYQCELFQKTDLMPGAAAIVMKLHQLGVPMAIATSSSPETFVLKTRNHGDLLSHFSTIVTGDQVERGKPAPDIFLLAANRLGIEPSRCVVLEDSPNGIKGALAAGMHAVWVPEKTEDGDLPDSAKFGFSGPVITLRSLEDFDPNVWGLY